MEEEVEPSQQYIDAFNLGYDLAKVSPKLADIFVGLKAESPLMNNVRLGINQLNSEKNVAREQSESRLPDWLTKDRFSQNADDLSKDGNVDKDDR